MQEKSIAYLDHAATTPLRQEAAEAMYPWMVEGFGNPSGGHSVARRALLAVDEAREEVAALIGCFPGEVIFTSGGTESDNLAVTGVCSATGTKPICTAIEHHAVLGPCVAAGGDVVPVGADGVVELETLERALTDSTGLVSVMLANNEVGTVQPLAEIVELVRSSGPDSYVHTDAVHAACWIDIAKAAATADLISLSSHKFGGPPGIGILVARSRVKLSPILLGGAQERGRRAGSHNVAGIVGMAVALRAMVDERPQQVPRVRALRDRLAQALGAIDGVTVTGENLASCPPQVAGCCHVRIDGVEQEEALILLDESGVCASAGSACASGAIEPSHVLIAMGMTPKEAKSSVRLTLGYTTTAAEVEQVISAFPVMIDRLRSR